MNRIYAIALNTFREAVRDRVLYGMLGLAIAMLLFSLALGELSLGQNERVVADVGMASISFFSVIMAVFLGSSLLYKEIERKTLYVILPKPIARYEFLLGKYFGILATCGVFVAIMGAVHLWVTAIQQGADVLLSIGVILAALLALLGLAYRASDRTAVVVPWAAAFLGAMAFFAGQQGAEVTYLLAAFALNVGELSLVAAVALLFSSFSLPSSRGPLPSASGSWGDPPTRWTPSAARASQKRSAPCCTPWSKWSPTSTSSPPVDARSPLGLSRTVASGSTSDRR